MRYSTKFLLWYYFKINKKAEIKHRFKSKGFTIYDLFGFSKRFDTTVCQLNKFHFGSRNNKFTTSSKYTIITGSLSDEFCDR